MKNRKPNHILEKYNTKTISSMSIKTLILAKQDLRMVVVVNDEKKFVENNKDWKLIHSEAGSVPVIYKTDEEAKVRVVNSNSL